MNRFIFAAALATLVLAGIAPPSAEARQRNRRRVAQPDYAAVTRTINDCEDRTDDFRKTLRRALKDSRLDDTHREDELNRQADRLENALDRTGDAWNRDRNPSKARGHVQEALGAARDINATMRKWRLHPDTERDWSVVRSQLNLLARAFNLNDVRW